MIRKNLTLILLLMMTSGCIQRPENSATNHSDDESSLISSLTDINARRLINPEEIDLKIRHNIVTAKLVKLYLQLAEKAARENNFPLAEDILNKALSYQPGNIRAVQELERLHKMQRLQKLYSEAYDIAEKKPEVALDKIQTLLEEEPGWPQAIKLRNYLTRTLSRTRLSTGDVGPQFKKRISLNFKSQKLTDIFRYVAELSGINIIYDNDVNKEITATILATDTTVEDALTILLLSNKLRKKVLNANSVLIYPATASKDKTYKNIMLKTYFLGYAQAKDVNMALRNMLKIKDIYVDERTNSLTVRGQQETLDAVQRLLITLDRPEAEVTLDIEVLEMSTSDVYALGINYPGSIGVGFSSSKNKSALSSGVEMPLSDFSKNNLFINLGNSRGVSVDLNQVRAKAKILANPRIRVKRLKKAVIDVGERIPVLTSTISESFNTEKVEYLDVGLKVEVTPDISLDGEISMDVDFSLSSLGLAEESKDRVKYYRTNKRAAKTVLSSRDGQTQVLAGLIRIDEANTEDGIPWVSRLPLIGKLFGSMEHDKKRAEVILLITPRIERNLNLPGRSVSTIPLGTDELPGSSNITLRSSGKITLSDEHAELPLLAPPANFSMKGTLPPPAVSHLHPTDDQ